jgi:hypothetical protein
MGEKQAPLGATVLRVDAEHVGGIQHWADA